MLKNLKVFLKRKIPFKYKYFIKRYDRKIFKYKHQKKITLEEMQRIIEAELHIRRGNTIIVHSSFGSLNSLFAPIDLIRLLKDIIGEEGNILMPYYPPMKASEWLKKGKVFDVKNTKSSTGILTNVFVIDKEVKISCHPIKALAVFGKNRDWLIGEHHKSITPFDKKSPYYRTLMLKNSKAIGLGIERNSFFHCCEDINKKNVINENYIDKLFNGKVLYYNQKLVEVKTYVHSPYKMEGRTLPCYYLKQTNCPNYIRYVENGCVFYAVDNLTVFEHTKRIWE